MQGFLSVYTIFSTFYKVQTGIRCPPKLDRADKAREARRLCSFGMYPSHFRAGISSLERFANRLKEAKVELKYNKLEK